MNGLGERVYFHNDVFATAGRARGYLDSVHTMARTSGSVQRLVGSFVQSRVGGTTPRCVTLWETDWDGVLALLRSHDEVSADSTGDLGEWLRRSIDQRSGGFNRFLSPGPGCPDLETLQRTNCHFEARPCVVQLVVTYRDSDEAASYLAGLEGGLPDPVVRGWRPLLWLGALHSPQAFLYFGSSTWSGVRDLAAALPAYANSPAVEVSFLHAGPASSYLRRDRE